MADAELRFVKPGSTHIKRLKPGLTHMDMMTQLHVASVRLIELILTKAIALKIADLYLFENKTETFQQTEMSLLPVRRNALPHGRRLLELHQERFMGLNGFGISLQKIT